MAVTPTGMFCHAHLGKILLADCSAWQTATGETDRDGGLEHILSFASDDRQATDNQKTPPRAIFDDPEDYETSIVGTKLFAETATVRMCIELPVLVDGTTVVTWEDQRNSFMNTVGAIIAEMKTKAGQGESLTGKTHLNVRRFEVDEGPFQVTPEEHPVYADHRDESTPDVPEIWAIIYNLLVHG